MDIPIEPATVESVVITLPVERKPPAGEDACMLVPVPVTACQHYRAAFQIDVKGGRCLCMDCKGEVSPMFVLEQLMHQESRWMAHRRVHQDEMERLTERSRTKCQHCGEITRISRR